MTKNWQEQHLDDRISILRYTALIKAIPKSSKEKIAKTDTKLNIDTLVITDKPQIKIKHKLKLLEKITSKEIPKLTWKNKRAAYIY